MKDLPLIWDGDTSPVIRLKLMDGGAIRDTTGLVVRYDVFDPDLLPLSTALVATIPGGLVSPKSGGLVDIYLRGRESDWDGVGKTLLCFPRILAPFAPNDALAAQLLLNGSLDATTGGFADSWVKAASIAVYTAPVAGAEPLAQIFGTVQQAVTASAAGADYFEQAVTSAGVAGDVYTLGVWYRVNQVGGAKDNSNAISIRTDSTPTDDALSQMEVGSGYWRFLSVATTLSVSHAALTPRIVLTAHAGTWQFDETYFFKGGYRQISAEPFRLIVNPRVRTAKTGGNLIAGVGSFQQDSNSDGVADAWTKAGSGNTFTVNQDPAHVSFGSKSQKVVLSNASGTSLTLRKRGHFKSGETWRATVKYKNAGALTGAPAPGDFALKIQAGLYDSQAPATVTTDFAVTSQATFATVTASIVLTADVDRLEIVLNLNTVAGTAYFDDAQLTRV